MSASTSSIFLTAILLNMVIAFYAATFVVEGILAIFPIKTYRTRATLRLIPFIILILDRIFTQFSFVNWLNPLSCESCMQKLSLSLFFPNLQDYLQVNELNLIHYLEPKIPHFSKIIFAIFCAITAFKVLRTAFLAFLQACTLNTIIQKSKPNVRPILNDTLSAQLKKSRTSIVISNSIQVPMAAFSNTIILPENFTAKLSQKEFEAVIAHEMAHICWNDSFFRLLVLFIRALFWWIPASSWSDKWLHDQELACDQNVLHFQNHSTHLASALIKVVKQIKNPIQETACAFADKPPASLQRLQTMLGIKPFLNTYSKLGFVGFSLEILFLGLCMIWSH